MDLRSEINRRKEKRLRLEALCSFALASSPNGASRKRLKRDHAAVVVSSTKVMPAVKPHDGGVVVDEKQSRGIVELASKKERLGFDGVVKAKQVVGAKPSSIKASAEQHKKKKKKKKKLNEAITRGVDLLEKAIADVTRPPLLARILADFENLSLQDTHSSRCIFAV